MLVPDILVRELRLPDFLCDAPGFDMCRALVMRGAAGDAVHGAERKTHIVRWGRLAREHVSALIASGNWLDEDIRCRTCEPGLLFTKQIP
jgi:hypothetical protein